MLGSDARTAKTLLTDWLDSLGVSMSRNEASNPAPALDNLIIKAEGLSFEATLYDNKTARGFQNMLPLTVQCSNMGVYYGGLEKRITTGQEGQLNFEDGDLT